MHIYFVRDLYKTFVWGILGVILWLLLFTPNFQEVENCVVGGFAIREVG